MSSQKYACLDCSRHFVSPSAITEEGNLFEACPFCESETFKSYAQIKEDSEEKDNGPSDRDLFAAFGDESMR